jgi:hypothetical protein
LDYIAPVFTDSKIKHVEIEDESFPVEVIYFYNNLLHETEFIIRSDKGEIIHISDKRKNNQRILAGNQRRIHSSSSLLYFPDDEQENILLS